jgi:DNA-binding GntR family transcriptional regulator
MSRSQNLPQKVHQQIITMMFDGVLAPGDALREGSLGEMLGMSRTPRARGDKAHRLRGVGRQ